jgi:hypothetical protein
MCSSINTQHSAFSQKERLEQTLLTIESIRQNNIEVFIILCDNTPLSSEISDQLSSKVNLFIASNGQKYDIEVGHFDFNSGKSTGESYQMLIILNELKNLNYTKCFKISGRYFLIEDFDANKFQEEKINFREFDYGYLCFSTVLYSFSKKHETILRNFFISYLSNTRKNDLEISIFNLKRDFPNEINNLEYLGVSGKLGPTRENLIH